MTFDELFYRLPLTLQDDMKNCMQDPRYHAEGSVYNHSKMVYEELLKTCNDEYEDSSMINAILISALFHDLGKLDTLHCYEKEKGVRIQSISHELYAMKYIELYKHLYKDFDIDWHIVVEICVEHMRAHKFIDGEIKKTHKRQYFIDRPYISLFAKADNLGRSNVNGKCFAILCMGIPGSGKTTWRKKFVEKHPEYVVICPDDIRREINGSVNMDFKTEESVWKEVDLRILYGFQNNKNIILDSTLCDIKRQIKYENICKGNNYIIVYKIFECNSTEAILRIGNDIQNKVDRSNVPNEVVDRMANNFVSAKERVIEQSKLFKVCILETKI